VKTVLRLTHMIKTKCGGRGCLRAKDCHRHTWVFQDGQAKKWMVSPHVEDGFGSTDQDCEFFLTNAAFKPAQMPFTVED
jgi:hypothetical protein